MGGTRRNKQNRVSISYRQVGILASRSSRPTPREVSPTRNLPGLQNWFFNYSSNVRRASCVNLVSAFQNPEVVTHYIAEEQALDRIIGPLDPLLVQNVHSSPFEVIPKHYSPGKWRLILDLSSPHGFSVSDGINPEWCSLSHISVDDVAKVVAGLGRGTVLGKMDIKSAYRMILIYPAGSYF